MPFKHFLTIGALLISTNSFALSLGSIQRNQFGETIGVTRSETIAICGRQDLKLPSSKQLAQILADKRNSEELKNAAFWSSEKGILLFGDFGYVADGWDWYDQNAGVICL